VAVVGGDNRGGKKMLPTITIQANGVIFNAEYAFPSGGFDGENAPAIVEPCKLTLDRLGVALLFNKDALTMFVEDEKKLREGKYGWLDHLLNFIIYKSRVNYRLYSNCFADDVTSFEACNEVDRALAFNLERLTRKQGIQIVGERYVNLGIDPFRLEIPRAEFDGFDKLIETSLAVAITYFLIASENPKYFLVEYYKCLEVIKKAFGGERKMFTALQPHGFKKTMYKTLTGDANSHREPISFGRHAPKAGERIIGVDLRALHTPTMQRDLFIKSSRICRACIDAYVSYLRARVEISATAGSSLKST
jgi:hypothetical protein